ncbi:MAG: hypothetical protein ACYS0H_05605 [Planctomycetota bacterium]|jgi:hypothetical protein
MKKYRTPWNLILIMSSLASGLLVIPPEAKAEMIASRMQSGKVSALVRQQLSSEIMQQEIQRFGLSKREARQMQAVISDERVVREMVQVERRIARTSRATIGQHMTGRLLTALQSSVETHMGSDLQQKLSDRAKGISSSQRMIASRLSTRGDTINARTALARVQRELTAEMLVALGMTAKDASETIVKLKDSDIDNIFEGGLQIGYPAGIDFSSSDGQLLLVIIVLAIVAIIVGGTAGVVLLILILIALVYYLGGGHW